MSFNFMGELLPIITELQERKLQVKTLNITTMDKDDGVIIQMTSPDKDGKYMAEIFGKLFSSFPKMLEGQGVTVNTSNLDKDGSIKY